MKNLYNRIFGLITTKRMSIFITALFLINLIPIIYVGLHNYPSGDDFWFGVYTNRAWVETGSLIEALKGSCKMVKEMYIDWQGTWFTLFLFTLSPNIFIEHGYYLTVFIGLGLLCGSFAYLLYFYLIQKLQISKFAFLIVLCLILYMVIQYIPRTTSGIFWFNGIMHYSVPLMLACIAVVNAHKFMDRKKIWNFIVLFICFTLLGGGSYLMPIAASLAVILIFLYKIEISKDSGYKIYVHIPTSNWLIMLALIAELIGLVISFNAPGNTVRGGEQFGVDLKWALQCVWYAIDRGIYLGIDYFTENIVILLIYILLAIFLWGQMWNISEKIRFRLPLFFVIFTNGIYWAAYTPEIYARSDVSGGVPNTYLQLFSLVTLANIIYVHGWIQNKIRDHFQIKTLTPALTILTILLVICSYKSEIWTTNDYCIDYVRSGKMDQYVEVREEQYKILMDDTIEKAIILEVGDQYPLLHMSLSENPTVHHNINQANFYGKESITAYRID